MIQMKNCIEVRLAEQQKSFKESAEVRFIVHMLIMYKGFEVITTNHIYSIIYILIPLPFYYYNVKQPTSLYYYNENGIEVV